MSGSLVWISGASGGIGRGEAGKLTAPDDAARGIWSLVGGDLDTGSVVDLRQVATSSSS